MKLNLDTANRMRPEIDSAISRVIESGGYIRGPEYHSFCHEFAKFCGCQYAVGVGSGTDALILAMRAMEIGPGDEVISPAHNVAYTALAIHSVGATPVFADVDRDTMTLSPLAAEAAITPRTKAIIPVHLYGHMARMPELMAVAERHGLSVIEDACQAHGASINGVMAGAWGDVSAFSFYPTKNLGCIGDGGMVVTNFAKIAESVAQLSDGGRVARYEHVKCGINTGLDELQAAMLRVKLRGLGLSNLSRKAIADKYLRELAGVGDLVLPNRVSGYDHVYHLFAVRTLFRDSLQRRLDLNEIPSLIHYPIPVHLQPCFSHLGGKRGQFPESEAAADQVLSIPMHPELSVSDTTRVVQAVTGFWVN